MLSVSGTTTRHEIPYKLISPAYHCRDFHAGRGTCFFVSLNINLFSPVLLLNGEGREDAHSVVILR